MSGGVVQTFFFFKPDTKRQPNLIYKSFNSLVYTLPPLLEPIEQESFFSSSFLQDNKASQHPKKNYSVFKKFKRPPPPVFLESFNKLLFTLLYTN